MRHLRAAGVTDVVLIGASKGGTAVVSTAPAIVPPPAAVVALSAPVTFSLMDAEAAAGRLSSPALYVVGRDDVSFRSGAERLHRRTPAAMRGGLVVVPGPEHGAGLLGGQSSRRVHAAADGFLATHAPPG